MCCKTVGSELQLASRLAVRLRLLIGLFNQACWLKAALQMEADYTCKAILRCLQALRLHARAPCIERSCCNALTSPFFLPISRTWHPLQCCWEFSNSCSFQVSNQKSGWALHHCKNTHKFMCWPHEHLKFYFSSPSTQFLFLWVFTSDCWDSKTG